jgi:hypothetical protein
MEGPVVHYTELIKAQMQNHIKNRGTGAGGSKTNANGLPYEEMTDLKTEYTIKKEEKHAQVIQFDNDDREFIMTQKSHFMKYMKDEIDLSVSKAHGCKQPDECFIDVQAKRCFIVEKKFQQCGGSVCEKIQTSEFKLWQYSRTFPDYKIIYVYCLSDWFKKNCKAELEYLSEKNVPVFWGNDKQYKTKMVHFILNYKSALQSSSQPDS